ncbi:MAG: lactonase family protein [Bacteroidetes bacterium]|nr:lactonase family protein [Bacteroidota bacterium]MBU1484683.1 lactonase family protein [Bacteroidota bacterium]MBU2267523.1 lactonase family protein [Bacteroidota bacterium]
MKKNTFLVALFIVFFISSKVSFAQNANRYYHLIIGTYTKTQDKGLFVYKFDSQTGDLTFESATQGIPNPSYLTISNDAKNVYCVNESGADRKGAVSAFNFDSKNGTLSFINSQPTKGSAPCHITLSHDQKFIFTANYTSGSISVLPVNKNGSIGELAQLIQHEGSSINENRQKEPHAHSVNFNPSGTILFNTDLGTDKIYAYDYHANEKQPLIANEKSSATITPGFGPRHFVFNQKGDKMYVLSELTATVSLFNYIDDKLTHKQDISLNDADFKGINGAAAIHISNDGKFLYATNRGSVNEIVCFKIDKKLGTLTKVGATSTLGQMPRDFFIDPTDNFILIAHQNSDDIFVFKRDQQTGLLTYANKKLEIGSPVCLKMTPVID